MSNLPLKYQWLSKEPAPRILLEALKLYGTQEIIGTGNNPVILRWAKECGIEGYGEDSIPWCALFISVVVHRAGKKIIYSPLWARSWAKWGVEAPEAQLGDILVFSRTGGGHVGIYVGEDSSCYHVLGGNQGDAVSIVRVPKERCIAKRRLYEIGVPPNVRKILLSSSGNISTNEA